LISNGTWDYKPPSTKDIPINFNVTMLSNTPNTAPNNIRGSKASGEPPYMLAASAFFAAKDAISAARADVGTTGYFTLNPPANNDQIQMACLVNVGELNLNPTISAKSAKQSEW
jgi:xanthine dehydrogenase/oxidase